MAKRHSNKNRRAGGDTEDLNPPEREEELIPVRLSAKELEERHARLPQLVAELSDTEQTFIDVKSKWNRKIKGLRGEIDRVAKALNTGEEMQAYPELPMS